MRLTEAQGRVLGCLVEKQLTTPQLYPLTDNALIAACNQSTNREPVVDYDLATVRLAVRTLREQELLRTVHRTGERSEKHRHLLDTALGLDPPEVALLAVLLLRGPQTPGELRARTERMHPFTAEQLEQVLAALAGREEPLVAALERRPGHKETRYVELLTERDLAADAAMAAPPVAARPGGLAAEVAELRSELAELRAEVGELRARLEV